MKLAGALLFIALKVAYAQELIVHVVDAKPASKPLSGIAVELRPDYSASEHRKLRVEKSDRNGVATFRNIDLSHYLWTVTVWNVATASVGPGTTLISPSVAQAQSIHLPSPGYISVFPAEITIEVRNRGFSERLAYIFRGP